MQIKKIISACEIDGVAYAAGQNVGFDDAQADQLTADAVVTDRDDSVGLWVEHQPVAE